MSSNSSTIDFRLNQDRPCIVLAKRGQMSNFTRSGMLWRRLAEISNRIAQGFHVLHFFSSLGDKEQDIGGCECRHLGACPSGDVKCIFGSTVLRGLNDWEAVQKIFIRMRSIVTTSMKLKRACRKRFQILLSVTAIVASKRRQIFDRLWQGEVINHRLRSDDLHLKMRRL